MSAIQKADPTARRRAVVIVAVIAAAGLALVAIVTSEDVMSQSRVERIAELLLSSPEIALAAGFVLMLPALFIAVYMFLLGGRVARAGRFPLPGQAVIRDTRIKEGPAAIRHARIIRLLALALLLWALALPFYLWFMFEQLA